MTQIKNIVFDFGGVLVDWNPRYLYDKYFGDPTQSQWFLDNICLYSWNLQMDGGKPFAEGVAELQAEHPEWAEAIGIYHTRWVEMMGGEVEGTASVLRGLKAAGYTQNISRIFSGALHYEESRFNFVAHLCSFIAKRVRFIDFIFTFFYHLVLLAPV